MKRCLDCHFLSKYHIDIEGIRRHFCWTEDERVEKKIPEQYLPCCFKGVWNAGEDRSFLAPAKFQETLTKDRNETCFYIKYQEGMMFDAATELYRMYTDNRQLKKSNRNTMIALWIAATGLVLNTIVQILK
ncbi:MAG: hypothetical protein F4Z81_14180 [Gemmatimonadetes bacterium]|nr:hypothetical protein [Gemmatimonadota bacterium]MYB60747.1 hypothetical protein [Gemmatimonadota bacterium]